MQNADTSRYYSLIQQCTLPHWYVLCPDKMLRKHQILGFSNMDLGSTDAAKGMRLSGCAGYLYVCFFRSLIESALWKALTPSNVRLSTHSCNILCDILAGEDRMLWDPQFIAVVIPYIGEHGCNKNFIYFNHCKRCPEKNQPWCVSLSCFFTESRMKDKS